MKEEGRTEHRHNGLEHDMRVNILQNYDAASVCSSKCAKTSLSQKQP